jgi:hypothetical protein
MSDRLSYRPSLRLVAILVAALGCGGDDPTGPFVPTGLAGQWSWTVSNASGSGRSCNVSGVTLTFTGSNGALGGSFAGSGGQNVSCTVGGQNTLSNFGGGAALAALSLTGSAITFTFTTTAGDWISTGNVTGPNTMTGSASIRLPSGGVVNTLTGTWTATRL